MGDGDQGGAFRDVPVALVLLRARSGKSMQEVSEEAGVSMGAIANAEGRGKERPTLEVLDSLLTYYGADLGLVVDLLETAGPRVALLRNPYGPVQDRRMIEEIWRELEEKRGDGRGGVRGPRG